jgi:hypothetical protein
VARDEHYKNAITNELFVTLAALLHQRSAEGGYLTWAQRGWESSAHGFIGPVGLVNDGITLACQNNGATARPIFRTMTSVCRWGSPHLPSVGGTGLCALTPILWGLCATPPRHPVGMTAATAMSCAPELILCAGFGPRSSGSGCCATRPVREQRSTQ